jgi:sortase (surface protein transpeptidase)
MKFLIIFLLIIFITPYIIRIISPFLLKYFFKKVEKNMNQQYQQQQNQNNQTNKSQSNYSYKKAKEELGDYVDFEEISEEK